MIKRVGVGLAGFLAMVALATAGCTGGQESTAAEEQAPAANSIEEAGAQASVNARQALQSISPAIPLYAGARLRDDLTRRDAVMIRSRYGDGAQVYTLATNDSFPQVYHYYTTYLAQFRAFPARDTYPSDQKDWRTLEVVLNEAMQDPFIPGAALDLSDRRVILQIAETEAEPKTVIRYIIAPGAAAPVAPAETVAEAAPASPEATAR
ncbi:MAG TPA: hypothetical protein VFT12_07930 [Thermoanaerobaculia bacterium]|nr:hypothetical protein [Thermoanaerobaculia bacterium]